MTNPFYDPYRILTKVYGEGAHLKIALAETPVEELHRARTVRTVYGVLEREGYLSLCIRAFAPKNPKQSTRILLKIALYWMIFLDKPRYMVTDTAVDLCKKMGKGGAAGFVNAFLRSFDEKKVLVPGGKEGLSVRYSCPGFAVERICAEYGDRAESVLASKSGGVSVRFVRDEEKYLARPHIPTPFPHLYLFERFAREDGFDRGDYTFQSVGSTAICSVVESCGSLLDACAAPGGKSVLLSERCGRVTACELHPHRVRLIESYCSRMGRENVEIVCADSSRFKPKFENAFDGVLCDVPCSGFGTLAENPDLPLRKREDDLVALTGIQFAILTNCARYVKEGGNLYYSTCSLFSEENDCVVGRFLRENSAFTPCHADSPLPYERMKYGIQFLPDRAFGAGFYISKLKKEKSV